MRVRFIVLALLALLFSAEAAAAQVATGAPHVAMALVPETTRPAAGGTVTLAIDARPAPGWHGYWKNGGDAGVETRLAWTVPAGASAGVVSYPVPGRLLISGLMNYVYERPFALLVDLKLPPGLVSGAAVPVRVKADYLVCTTTLCVPETQTLQTMLTIGDGTIDAATRARFDSWRRAIPRPLGSPARFTVAAGKVRIAIPYPAGAALREAYFYPLTPGLLDYAAPQKATREGDMLTIETAPPPIAAPVPARIAGVLALGDGSGLALVATPGPVGAVSAPAGWRAALLAFAGALLGGVLLNVMPCVFPILSLKALSLAKAGTNARAARGDALAYTAGVVLVCVALGGALLALRAGGASVGWAFQLQDPRVILLLLVLTLAITLNLAGVFEVPTPRFAARSGGAGAFATGALAAFVATPCSGPFMGAALGAALVLPPLAALLVFAGLGLGIALPFLAIGFVPALRRRLPRPGRWMGALRKVLAVPMALTAVALVWVLRQEAGNAGLAIGAAAVLVLAAGLWVAGGRQRRGLAAGWALAVPALALAGAFLVRPVETVPAVVPGALPFSEARLAALRRENRPVFAYFTADWCLTCKVNERVAIDTDAARAAFRRSNTAVLVGDWTNGDPALGRFIEAHGRAGVPLYLYYPAGSAEPRVLPQILTPGMLASL